MTIKLRPHHLLCMLTFSGQGYTPSFSRNFRKIVDQIANGADVMLVSGPDDICKPMLWEGDKAHCNNHSVRDRDQRAFQAIGDLGYSDLAFGNAFSLDGEAIGQLRRHFKTGSVREACGGCEWFDLCTQIANEDFRRSILHLSDEQ